MLQRPDSGCRVFEALLCCSSYRDSQNETVKTVSSFLLVTELDQLRLDDKGICRQFANRLSVPLPPVVRMFGMAIDV